MRVIFMGTPEFAVGCLKKLQESKHEVVGVVTIPDKQMGRGLQLMPSAVKVFAEAHGLRLFQPEKLREETFIGALTALDADVAVVVAFRMLPKVVWAIPKKGTLNLHASLLPNYRGAAPINWAIINGEKKTGVTTFWIDEEIDTGKILLQHEIEIEDDWNAGNLHDALMETGADLIVETLSQLEAGTLIAQAQDESAALYKAPKIFKEDGLIDWNQPAVAVHHFVRGMSPYPTAYTFINGKMVKILRTKLLQEANIPGQCGDIQISPKKDSLKIGAADGFVEVLELQVEGKKRLAAGDFLRGWSEIWTHTDR